MAHIKTVIFGEIAAADAERLDAVYEAANTCGCGHSKRMHYDGGCQAYDGGYDGRRTTYPCKCDEFEPGPVPGASLDVGDHE